MKTAERENFTTEVYKKFKDWSCIANLHPSDCGMHEGKFGCMNCGNLEKEKCSKHHYLLADEGCTCG
jgi:hypothetical protein